MRVALPHLQPRTLAFVLCVFPFAPPVLGAQPTDNGPPARARAAPEQRPVLLVYSEHGLSEESWAALFAALRANLPEAAAKVPASEANPQFLRGDDPANGNLAGEVITVQLRGDCRPSVQHVPFPGGESLGWVSKVGKIVVPIIHVECTQIGEQISGRTQWMNRNERTAAMSEAIARVTLHEWVHVAAQSAAHGSDGITKAIFSTDDLLCSNQTPESAWSGKDRSNAICRASSVADSARPLGHPWVASMTMGTVSHGSRR
jgi:hypothetical protein